MKRKDLLLSLNIGDGNASREQNKGKLGSFFMVHDVLWEILDDKIDLLVGLKGAGKTNLFLFLTKHASNSNIERVKKSLENVIIAGLDVGNQKRGYVTKFEEAARDGDSTRILNLWWELLTISTLKAVHKKWDIEDPVVKSALRKYRLLRESVVTKQAKRIKKVGPVEFVANESEDLIESYPEEILEKINEIAKRNGQKIWILIDNLEDVVHHTALSELKKVTETLVFDIYIKGVSDFDSVSVKIFSRWDIYLILRGWDRDKLSFGPLTWDGEQVIRLLLTRLIRNSGLYALTQSVLVDPSTSVDDLLEDDPEALLHMIFAKCNFRDSTRSLYEYIGEFFLDSSASIQPRWIIKWCNRVIEREKRRTVTAAERGQREASLPLFSEAAILKAFDDVSEWIVNKGWPYEYLEKHRQALAEAQTWNFDRAMLEDLFRNLDPSGIDAIERLWATGLLRGDGPYPTKSKYFDIPLLFQQGLVGLKRS